MRASWHPLLIVVLCASFALAVRWSVASEPTISRPATTPQVDQAGQDIHSRHTTSLPVAVDGAISPERIPDRLAYRHFVMSVALADDATTEEVAARDAALDHVGLSDDQRGMLISVLRGVGDELNGVAEGRRSVAAALQSSGPSLDVLRRQQDEILDNARLQLRSILNADSVAAIDTHIRQHVKRRIIVYGAPPGPMPD
jgi:hypothetical protein